MNRKKAGMPPIYPCGLKIAIAREYLSSDLSQGDLAKKYGYSKGTIAHFVKWHKQYSDSAAEPPQLDVQPGIVSPEDKAIAKQLAEANLKIAALEMLIENAGKELGVDIVKKPGTGQSAK